VYDKKSSMEQKKNINWESNFKKSANGLCSNNLIEPHALIVAHPLITKVCIWKDIEAN
jgi:hypothetical protein